jgi:uncharacterized protein
MLLDLSRMQGAHERLARTYDAAAFGPGDEVLRVSGPVSLVLDLHKTGTQVHLVGRIQTSLELTCSRCLEPCTVAFDQPFDVLYLPQAEPRAQTGEPEVEVNDDDLSVAFYQDEVIDLGQLMREQFYLAAPMKPLCAEDCRGLCPVCGGNLNTSPCSCAPQWQDPRLSALQALKSRQSGD